MGLVPNRLLALRGGADHTCGGKTDSISPFALALVERLDCQVKCRIHPTKCRFCLIPLVARRRRAH